MEYERWHGRRGSANGRAADTGRIGVDLWLGPRKFRPYNRRWMRSWHNWREFGTQQLGNWAIHSANMQFKGLKIDSLWYADPATKPRIRVRAEVSEIARYAFPKWEKIRYEIPSGKACRR